jgi:carboxymethylenebutenolidase
MNGISRRMVMGGLASLTLASSTQARTLEEVRTAADDGEILSQRYAADGDGRRSIVLTLHGNGGFEVNARGYARYPEALAAAGIDAWLVHYYTSADAQALDPKTTTRESRGAYNAGRFAGWSRRASSVVGAALARPSATAASAFSASRSAASSRRRRRATMRALRRSPCSTPGCRTGPWRR